MKIGFTVKDAEKTAEYYARNFGWGPWSLQDFEFRNYAFRGKTHDYAKIKTAIAFHGSLIIELVEPIEGETPFSEFLRERGEGINHLHIGNVDDFGPLQEKLAAAGIEPVFQGQLPISNDLTIDVLLTDTERIGGVTFEFTRNVTG